MKKITTLFLLVFSISANAYVPPSFFIAKTIAKKHSDITSGQFKHRISFYKKSGEESKSVIENLILNSNGEFQATILEDSTSIYEHKSKPTSAVFDLLFNRDAGSVFDHLKNLELPMRTEKELYTKKEDATAGASESKEPEEAPVITDASEAENAQILAKKTPKAYTPEPKIGMVRYENRTAVVLGLGNSTQLWLEKDSLIPLRLILPSSIAKADDNIEYRFSGYMLYKSTLYPRTTQIFKNDKLWAKIETSEVNVGTVTPIKVKEADSAGSDLKKNLEEFYKLAR